MFLTFGTWGVSSRVREVHPRYLDDTQYTRRETSQQWHWVGVLVDSHRLGDEMIRCRGGASVITEPTLGEPVMRETCIIFPSGHVEIMHEQRIRGTTEVVSQYVSGLQTLYRHVVERVDGMFDADEMVEVEQEGIPSVCQGEDSFSHESIGSVEAASGERGQSYMDGDSRPELYSSVQGEQSWDSTRDTLGGESLVTI